MQQCATSEQTAQLKGRLLGITQSVHTYPIVGRYAVLSIEVMLIAPCL